jgi:hypothetical protein
MILLIMSLAKAQDCAQVLQDVTGEPTQVAATLHEATAKLQAQEYSAVVIDQLLLDAEPEEGETALKHMEMAVPVYLNFALSGIERVTRELRSALQRRKREVLLARHQAQQALCSELNDKITALQVSCEMALKVENLPPGAESKMRAVGELAQEMREKLRVEV